MMNLALSLFGDPDLSNMGLWIFLSVGAVSLFVVFIPLVSFIDGRRKEREAFYKAETVRRLSESSGEGAAAAVELLREEAWRGEIKKREGLKIGGIIMLFIGLALAVFLGVNAPHGWAIGLIPASIGAAMLVYVYLLASPLEHNPQK